MFLMMSVEHEIPPPELGPGPLRGPAPPDLDRACGHSRQAPWVQSLATWLKVKPDPDPGVQARAIVSFLADHVTT